MTREEAIEFGNTILMFAEQEKDSHTYEFTKMAVEALSAEPCEDCITLRLEKGTLKYSDKDYVVYKKEWLKKWWQPELALLGIQPKPKTDVLDKIRTEIIENSIEDYKYHGCGTDELIIETTEVLNILDKYKAESENKE